MTRNKSRDAFDIVPWSQSFETGVEIIDEQHRQLVNLLNNLAHQYVYGFEAEQFKDIVSGLVDYAKYHFETEECLWEEAFEGDEWLVQHRNSHDGFVGKVREMQAQVEHSATLSGIDDLLSFLISWLAHHILHDDRSMAFALKELRKGQTLADAKAISKKALSGQASSLIHSVLAMYKQLSGYTLALQREVHARDMAERQLREQESYWKSVLGATNDSLWDCNLQVSDVTDREDTAKFLTKAGQRIHPEDWPGVREDLIAHLLGNTEVFSHHYRVLESNGKECWVQSRGKVIAHDSDGRPLRIIGTQTDITERKTQELVLLRERDTRLLISDFASDFMTSAPEEFDTVIERALQRGGEYMGADRTYIFLVDDNREYMSNTHEWCAAGISPEIDNLKNIPSNLVPWWWQQLSSTGYVLVPEVSGMPPEAHAEYVILESQGIKSVCVYPLYMKDELTGFLGNDAVQAAQNWGADVLEFLGLMSDLLSIALEYRQLQKHREQARRRLERAEQQAHVGHWGYDLNSGEVFWSEETSRIIERDLTFSAPTYLDMVHPEDRKEAYEAFQKAKNEISHLQTEHRVCLSGDRNKYLEVRGQFEAGPDGKPARVEGTVQDVSERVEHREQLRRLAYEDELTGLPNRRALDKKLQQEVEHCKQHGKHLVMALLDLDNFREANDRYGPALGDEILVALSRRMQLVCGESAVVSRIGGDEFVVLFPRMVPDDDAFPQLRRLLAAINEPLVVSGVEVNITVSIGVTSYPQPGNPAEEQLFRQVQQALYQAKMQGKNRLEQYDIQLEHNTRALTCKLEEIKQALLDGEFVLYYQPQVSMAEGTVLGVEALIRWQKPSGEIVPPGVFLPVIQDHPLEVEIGDWVINAALSQIGVWQEHGLHLEVSVNVTSLQILDDSFTSKLKAELAVHPLVPARALKIEILESSALHDLEKVSRVMRECRKLGVQFALDDFGTGFSSLSYLKHLPANILKIDQSFVRNMLNDPGDLSIISGIVGMSQAFGLQVLAEGVETEEHGDLLLRLGCELGQGYGIARPMKAEDLPGWVLNWQIPSDWHEQKPVAFQNILLLHAEVEHRYWVNRLEQWLQGKVDVLPTLQATHCKVGSWIEQDGRRRFKNNPAFIELVIDHERLHQAGDEAVAAHAHGGEHVVNEKLSEIRECRDRVLLALRRLQS
ncbi:bacteriohemerythrin [Marinobacter sp. S6332]|uniref:bacteriohemerythrin n=1 Tax=Marinobacter sp. S6332 TaxID=2926403 RepID=UPI001FF34D53|nr:bacteriohemerythrin [Marinobacter sp. S6332]MCK0163575.1 bacteriohemerythrin [Marinobacter sp. S6332]